MHNVPILSIIAYLPLAGALLIAFGFKSSQGALIRKLATGIVFVDFLLSLPLAFLALVCRCANLQVFTKRRHAPANPS